MKIWIILFKILRKSKINNHKVTAIMFSLKIYSTTQIGIFKPENNNTYKQLITKF